MILTNIGCNVNWKDPLHSQTTDTCVWTLHNELYFEKIRRVHVHSDNRHHLYFINNLLPLLEKHKPLDIIVHSGGGDSTVNEQTANRILDSPVVKKWVVEQNKYELLLSNKKIYQLPIGICPHENLGKIGETLRKLMTLSKTIPWNKRKNKIFFCFSEGYENRKAAMKFAQNCSFCDFCDTKMSHLELWSLYLNYKFVFSPLGNGPDCGRNWEILMLGAVPVIEYFPGALGYVSNNLPVVTVKDYRNNLESNIFEKWLGEFRNGTNDKLQDKLSLDYWLKNALEL